MSNAIEGNSYTVQMNFSSYNKKHHPVKDDAYL